MELAVITILVSIIKTLANNKKEAKVETIGGLLNLMQDIFGPENAM